MMIPTRVPLRNFQQWMLSVIEHPGNDHDAWNSHPAIDHLPFADAYANVLPSDTLGSMERIGIYRRMFYLRMTESMEIDYPGVLHAIGRESFRRLITEGYVQRFPSHSYTLNKLGQHFPQFLQESGLEHAAFLSELARLELSLSDLMDEREPENGGPHSLGPLHAANLESSRITFVRAFRLEKFEYPAPSFLREVQNDGSPVVPSQPHRSNVVLFRHEFEVDFIEVPEEEFLVLKLLHDGKTVGEALSVFLTSISMSPENISSTVFHWFDSWMENGWIHRILSSSEFQQ